MSATQLSSLCEPKVAHRRIKPRTDLLRSVSWTIKSVPSAHALALNSRSTTLALAIQFEIYVSAYFKAANILGSAKKNDAYNNLPASAASRYSQLRRSIYTSVHSSVRLLGNINWLASLWTRFFRGSCQTCEFRQNGVWITYSVCRIMWLCNGLFACRFYLELKPFTCPSRLMVKP